MDSWVSAVAVVKKNRFAPELNEKEVVELLENATPGSIKKATKFCTCFCLFKTGLL